MIGKAVSSLVRPAVRNHRVLLNGSQRMFQTSSQAVKALQTQKNNPTAKELYQQSIKINTAFFAQVKSALAVKTNGAPPLQAGMPQLVPFFFVNEVVFGFALMVPLIWLFSKYFLPRYVRTFAARLFISKL